MLTMAEAMLQIKYPRGEVQSIHYQTKELSVTQKSKYESAAEREYAEQEKLKYWYENNVGYHVWKKKCEPAARCFTLFVITAGIVIYPIAEVLRSRSEMKKENRGIIQSISVLSVQHLLYPNGITPGFAAMPAGKRNIEKTIRRTDIYENVRYVSYLNEQGLCVPKSRLQWDTP